MLGTGPRPPYIPDKSSLTDRQPPATFILHYTGRQGPTKLPSLISLELSCSQAWVFCLSLQLGLSRSVTQSLASYLRGRSKYQYSFFKMVIHLPDTSQRKVGWNVSSRWKSSTSPSKFPHFQKLAIYLLPIVRGKDGHYIQDNSH